MQARVFNIGDMVLCLKQKPKKNKCSATAPTSSTTGIPARSPHACGTLLSYVFFMLKFHFFYGTFCFSKIKEIPNKDVLLY